MPAERAKRFRDFTFEVYPESAPPDFLDTLRGFHVPMYFSLHDKDATVNRETGEITAKKLHGHVLAMHDSPKPIDCLDEVIEAVNGVKPPLREFIVRNKRSMARYLSHMDEDPEDPGKYPYYLDPEHRVIAIGGAEDYNALCRGVEETKREERNAVKDIQDYCERKGIRNMASFLRLVRATDHDNWLDEIRLRPYFWGAWFKAWTDETEEQAEAIANILGAKGGNDHESEDD